jgi:hypothetical protein
MKGLGMNWMPKIVRLVFVLSLFGWVQGTANAALVGLNLSAEGDGLVTLDTATNLEWLDLSATSNLYYPYVKLYDQGGWQAAGWKIATKGDVQGLLFGNTGLQEGVYGNGVAQSTPLKTLMELLGVMYVWNDASGNPNNWRNYIAFNDGTDNGWVGRAFMEVGFYGSITTGARWYADTDGFTDSNSSGPILFLREHQPTPVPLPPSILLFGSGLIGIAGFIRKKRVR